MITQLSEFVPSSSGIQIKLEALNICHSCLLVGLYISGHTNMSLANKECQAVSVVTLTGK